MDTDCQTTRASGEIITDESPLPTFIEFTLGGQRERTGWNDQSVLPGLCGLSLEADLPWRRATR